MTRRSLLLLPFALLAGRPFKPAHVRDLQEVIAAYEALLTGQMRAYQAAMRAVAGLPGFLVSKGYILLPPQPPTELIVYEPKRFWRDVGRSFLP